MSRISTMFLVVASVAALSACPGPNAPVTNNAAPAKKPAATPAKSEPAKPELAKQAELIKQAQQAEIAKQAELTRQAEIARQQAEIARQQADAAKEAELARQAELTRQAELAKQAEVERQEIARQVELAKQAQAMQIEQTPAPAPAPAPEAARDEASAEAQPEPAVEAQDEVKSEPAELGKSETPVEPEVKLPKYALEQGQHYKHFKGLGNIPVPAVEIDLENGNTYFFCLPSDAQKAPVHILASTSKVEQMREKGELFESIDGNAVITIKDLKRGTLTNIGCVAVRK